MANLRKYLSLPNPECNHSLLTQWAAICFTTSYILITNTRQTPDDFTRFTRSEEEQ